MRLATVSATVIVLGIAGWATIAFAGCGGNAPAALVWLSPAGAPIPATHTYVQCTESGANTQTLNLNARNLGPGDACQFSAKLHNTGSSTLRISDTIHDETGHGQPSFTTCFSFTLSAGPSGGRLAGGASFPYTFTVQFLSSAPHTCTTATGTVTIAFTGSPD